MHLWEGAAERLPWFWMADPSLVYIGAFLCVVAITMLVVEERGLPRSRPLVRDRRKSGR